jgi:hypothetical protein
MIVIPSEPASSATTGVPDDFVGGVEARDKASALGNKQ